MREIIFRGKRLDNGKWVYGSFCPKNGEGDIPCIIVYNGIMAGWWYEVDSATVGQYTGLKDKKGQRIFEGDILRYNDLYALKPTGCVCYGENEWNGNQNIGFYMKWLTEEVPCLLRTDLGFWCNEREVEVIGNIHDQSLEALNGKKTKRNTV